MIVDGFLNERTESLYVCEEYGIFLLTGQPNATSRRCAYIAAKAFHTIDDGMREEMAKTAEPWTEKGSDIRISSNQGALSFRDNVTGTFSALPWTELDNDVQLRLRGDN